jgi:uncharacterized membrane protein required for colicin V production
VRLLLDTGYSLPSLAADFLVVLVIGLNVYLGYRSGLIRRAIALVAVFGAAVSAYNVGNPIAGAVGGGTLYANAWSFTGVFVLVIVMLEILGALYADRLERIITIAFDRVAGAIAGVIIGGLEVGVLFMVALATGQVQPTASNHVPSSHAQAADAVRSGALSGLIVKLEPGIESVMRPAIPIDLAGHLSEGIDKA